MEKFKPISDAELNRLIEVFKITVINNKGKKTKFAKDYEYLLRSYVGLLLNWRSMRILLSTIESKCKTHLLSSEDHIDLEHL